MNIKPYFQPIEDSYFQAHAQGKIRFGMTNDYMFRAVLQEARLALQGLIASLLHLEPSSISFEITNPIMLGESISEKEYHLDLNIKVNGILILNLEMQNLSDFWNNRSLVYLCRAFDNVLRGHDYDTVSAVMHIGFLNFTLFKDEPEFYSSYKLMNEKTHRVYNDGFSLRCINLTKIDLATEDDKLYNVDKWATFLKADSWEVVKVLAKEDTYINDAAKKLFLANEDEQLRDQAFYAEEHQLYLNSLFKKMDRLAREISDKDAALADKDAALADKDAALADKDAALADKDATIARLQAEIANYKKTDPDYVNFLK